MYLGDFFVFWKLRFSHEQVSRFEGFGQRQLGLTCPGHLLGLSRKALFPYFFTMNTIALGVEMPLVKVSSKRQITLPQSLTKELGIKEGDRLEVAREGDRLVIKPVMVIDRSDAWFYTPEWQAKEREADEEIARGELGEPIESTEDLQKYFDKIAK